MNRGKQRMVQILSPKIGKTPPGWVPSLSDYIHVPHILTVGTYPLIEFLDGPSALNLMKIHKRVNGTFSVSPRA